MNDDEIRDLLEGATCIAVVGASKHPEKDAHAIPKMLQRAGYRVIPVNPNATEVLGERAYPTLADVPERIDIVNVFRPSDEAAGVALQAVSVGAGAVWLQLGVASEEARELVEGVGLPFVEDRCIGVDVRHFDTHPPDRTN